MIRRAWILSLLLPLLAGSSVAASRTGVDYCIDAALRPKVISFRSTDGVPLHGVLLGSGRNGIVLYGGGGSFRGDLCDWLPFAQTLAQRGYRVLAYDSRPGGPGPPGTAVHLERDVVGAERELVRRGVRRALVGGGFVFGTAAMTAAAPRRPIRRRGPEALRGVGLEPEAARRRALIRKRHAAPRAVVGSCQLPHEAPGVHRRLL